MIPPLCLKQTGSMQNGALSGLNRVVSRRFAPSAPLLGAPRLFPAEAASNGRILWSAGGCVLCCARPWITTVPLAATRRLGRGGGEDSKSALVAANVLGGLA